MNTKIYIILPVLTFNYEDFENFLKANQFIRNSKNISIFLKVKRPISLSAPNLTIHIQDDNSIYEAWNQSIMEIRRKEKNKIFYITFCGIDDILNKNFIAECQKMFDSSYDVIFGNIIIFVKNKKHKKYANPNSSMFYNSKKKIWDIYHPGMLMNSRLFGKTLFDEEYKLAADFKFFAYVSNNLKIKSKYIPLSQATININGISNINNAREIYFKEFKKIEEELNINISGFNRFLEYAKLLILRSPFADLIKSLYWSLK